MLCDLLSWVRRTTVRKDLTVTSIIITSLLFFISCHICSSWYSSFHIIRKPLHQSPTCFLFVLMMLSLWHSLHCSHDLLHNTKLYSQSKYTCFSILGSKNHSIQSNADIFPSHVYQVFFSFPIFNPMIYYTTTNSTSNPTTYTTRFWIRRISAYFQSPTYFLLTSIILRLSFIFHLFQWSATQHQTLL